jgi:hypothetical protein
MIMLIRTSSQQVVKQERETSIMIMLIRINKNVKLAYPSAPRISVNRSVSHWHELDVWQNWGGIISHTGTGT